MFPPRPPLQRAVALGSLSSVSPVSPQVKAHLLCGRLRQAYLQAVKLDPVLARPRVQEVLQAAEGTSDSVMRNICDRWLSEHQNKSPQQRQNRPNAR